MNFYILITVLCVSVNVTFGEEFKFKVIAPEYVCSTDNLSQTAIRLIGDDIPNLIYNWSIDFTLENVHSIKQRNVLILWRSLRNINSVFNKIPSDNIDNGVLFINNSILSPGVKYIFNITAQKLNDSGIDTRQFTLELVDKSMNLILSTDLSGPEITYSDMMYTARAEVSSCSDNPDYLISWEVLDKNNIMINKKMMPKSRILQLQPGTLISGNSYLIKFIVEDYHKNMTNQTLNVKVLERGLQLNIFIKYLKIGLNQSIYINAIYRDPDYLDGDLMFEWQCTNSKQNVCTDFESSNSTELVLKNGISIIGSYKFTLTAKKGKSNATTATSIDIVEELLPIIEVEHAMTSCNPTDSLKISAHISRLITGCKLEWTSIENGYSYVNLNNLPGTPGKLIELTENTNEIDESAEFFEKQFDLILPKPKNGSWKGLESNSKYLFRLQASCPCSEDSETVEQTFLTSSADVEVYVKSAPELKPFQVTPKSGQALKTLFNFIVQPPENCSKPLFYKFGYLVKDKHYFIINQYEHLNAITILPAGVLNTIIEVCDSNSVCSFTSGPEIKVELPENYAESEISSLISKFNKSIFEQDYFTAFTLASITLKTTSKMPQNHYFIMLYDSIVNITKTELNSFISKFDESLKPSATNLLKYIKNLDKQFSLPDDILSEILTLRDKLSIQKQQNKSEKLQIPVSRKLLSLQSQKEQRIVNNINIDDIKDNLEISELAIKRLNDYERVEKEKRKLRDTLENYVPRICQFLYNNYKNEIRIELSTVILSVEKINLIRKFNQIISIPYESNLAAQIILGKDIAEKYKNQIGLYTALLDDYLNTDMDHYGIIIEMPIKNQILDNQFFQCVLWMNEKWDKTKCKTLEETSTKIKCVCKSLGYFSLIPIDHLTTTMHSNTIKMSSAITQFVTTATTYLFTTNNELLTTHSIDEAGNYKTLDNNTHVFSAAVWSISFLSLGILTIFIVFFILLKRLDFTKSVQTFHTVEYAKYLDEFNLEE